MKIRKIRIWLSRGWYHVVCSVSLLLLPFFCATAKGSSVVIHAWQDVKDTVSVKEGDIVTGIVRKPDGKPFPGVRIYQGLIFTNPNCPYVVTDENGKFELKVTDPTDRLYFMHDGYVTQYWYVNRYTYDVMMYDAIKEFDKAYNTRQALEDRTKPGILIMSAYGTPWKGSSGINVQVQQDTTLTQLTDDMIEKIRAYEKKSNPTRMVAYGPPFENGEEETILDLQIPSKRELRKARRAERKKKD